MGPCIEPTVLLCATQPRDICCKGSFVWSYWPNGGAWDIVSVYQSPGSWSVHFLLFFLTFLTIQYDCLLIGVVLCYRLVSFGTNMGTSVLSRSKLFMAAFCTFGLWGVHLGSFRIDLNFKTENIRFTVGKFENCFEFARFCTVFCVLQRAAGKPCIMLHIQLPRHPESPPRCEELWILPIGYHHWCSWYDAFHIFQSCSRILNKISIGIFSCRHSASWSEPRCVSMLATQLGGAARCLCCEIYCMLRLWHGWAPIWVLVAFVSQSFLCMNEYIFRYCKLYVHSGIFLSMYMFV